MLIQLLVQQGRVGRALTILWAAAVAGMPAVGWGATSFEEALKARSSQTAEARLTPVREEALRASALSLGSQWGLGDRSREIDREIDRMSTSLDDRFQFGALMMGVGFLPPVISEARDAVAIDGQTMRVAKRIWRIDEEPRPVAVAPTWRDWLYVGLDAGLRPQVPGEDSLLPRNAAEEAFWQDALRRAYREGRQQAQESFESNLAHLQRSYDGMRRFYDLYRRGLVTAPVIAAATSIIDFEDPNTVVVGNAVFRVVRDSRFVEQTDSWVPLGK